MGMLPRTIFVAYLGSSALSLTDLTEGDSAFINDHVKLYWAGLVLSLLVTVYLTNKALRLINEAIQ